MKFKMTITQEIIDKSICSDVQKCAFATAYNELVPNVIVASSIAFYGEDANELARVGFIKGQVDFINYFDNNKQVKPQTFEVEIPDSVIEYWYQDAAEAAAKIANSKILELI